MKINDESTSRRSLRAVAWALCGLVAGLAVAASDHWSLSSLIMAVLVGLLVGFVTGWAGRTSENARWAAECRTLVARAEQSERLALEELEKREWADSQRVALPVQAAMPAINVHVHTGGGDYRDLAGATAAAVASQLPLVLEAGEPGGW